MRKAKYLIKKEMLQILKDRKTLFSMVIFPIMMFVILGSTMGSMVTNQIKEALTHPLNVVVISQDPAPKDLNVMYLLTSALRRAGLNFTLINVTPDKNTKRAWEEVMSKKPSSFTQLYQLIREKGEIKCNSNVSKPLLEKYLRNGTTVLVVPGNFSWNVFGGWFVPLYTYVPLPNKPISIGASTLAEREASVGEVISKAISEFRVKCFLPEQNPMAFLNPVVSKVETWYLGSLYPTSPSAITSSFMGKFMMIPIIAYLIVFMSTTLSATNIGSEKQNKTLETLLTLPVTRNEILVGKLFGTMFPAILSTISYLIGFKFYLSSFQASGSLSGSTYHEAPKIVSNLLQYSMFGYLIIGVTIFLTVAISGLIGLIVGIYTDSPRSASSMTSAIVMPLALPVFALMYVPVDIFTPIGALLFLDPFSHIVISAESALVHDYMTIAYSMAYLASLTTAMFLITARLFNSEKIVTGGFKKKRRSFGASGLLWHWPRRQKLSPP